MPIQDLKSADGIQVNHVSVREHLLRPGANLSIGKLEYIIDYETMALRADDIDPPADPF